MKGFRFRLARLERVRRTQERVERSRWAAAADRVREALERAGAAGAACEQGLAELRAAQGQESLAPSDVLRAQDALRRLAVLAARERALAERRGAEAEAARAVWLARRAQVEGLERWRERERRSHSREAERAAARDLDETAGRRAAEARRAPEGGPAPKDNCRSHPHSPEFPVHLQP